VVSDGAGDVLAKLETLHLHRPDGQSSPHKPLLLLLALGLLENNGSSELPWSEAEVALADLITQFAPSSTTAAVQRAAHPFTHLRADKLWVLDRDVAMDSVRELNAGHVTGRLEPTLEAAFRADPELLHDAARMLVMGNFSEAKVPYVLDAVGLDPEVILGTKISPPDVYHSKEGPQPSRGSGELAEYLQLTVSKVRPQFRMLLERQPVSSGRQVRFMPVETLLCLAASFVVNHHSFGGANAHRAPEPVPSLARLFSRRPSSVLAKMANLDDSRPHGAKWDALAGAVLREQPRLFSHVYRVLLHSARAEGIGSDRLSDFLRLEHGGEFELLGQDELGLSEMDDLRNEAEAASDSPETERIMLAAVRAGQHIFALNVLRNCGGCCVFCGLNPSIFGARRMLIAGHIKPWRKSSSRERLDIRNGLAACPAHDIAFDTGLIAIEDDLHIRVADALIEAMRTDRVARQYYGRPTLREKILLPPSAQFPNPKYLDWHRQYIFAQKGN
jgi:putative restriction endonuclease